MSNILKMPRTLSQWYKLEYIYSSLRPDLGKHKGRLKNIKTLIAKEERKLAREIGQ